MGRLLTSMAPVDRDKVREVIHTASTRSAP